jgi:ATP-dependent Clp protease ATP-binding subunit ClpA
MWSAGLDFRGGVAMFEDFSERARRVIFFSRKVAGERGAAAIEVEHLIEALLLEDQADYAKMFPESAVPGAARMALPTHRPFFTTEVAAEIQRRLEPLMPSKAQPLPGSVDMPVSDALAELFATAIKLGEELRSEPARPSRMQVGHPARPSRIQAGHVQPLHLLAAALSDETSATAEVLKQAGITKEAVIPAIKSGEYS